VLVPSTLFFCLERLAQHSHQQVQLLPLDRALRHDPLLKRKRAPRVEGTRSVSLNSIFGGRIIGLRAESPRSLLDGSERSLNIDTMCQLRYLYV
jgi:hypothetical protein